MIKIMLRISCQNENKQCDKYTVWALHKKFQESILMSLPKFEVSEIGRQLLQFRQSNFLKVGITITFFKDLGNSPFSEDRFIKFSTGTLIVL